MGYSVLRAFVAVLFALTARVVHAQASAPPALALPGTPGAATGDSLTISVVTIGQGTEVWELFGHDEIWVHDATSRTDSIYDWGRFDLDQKGFIPHFLRGRMLYSMGTADLASEMRSYRGNRTMWVQQLDLTPAERAAVRDYVRWNEQPANRPYLYDYFLDNCATRLRDVFNRAVGGAVQAQLTAKTTSSTYRSHSLRLMQREFFLMTGVDIGLGREADKPLSQWEESFLPGRLQEDLRGIRLDGGARPLVKSERVLQSSNQPPEPTTQPRLGLMLPGIGLVLAALIGLAARSDIPSQLVGPLILGSWSLVAGLLGVFLTLLWSATDHHAAHRNENLFLFHPLWLAGLPIAVAIARGRYRVWHRRVAATLVAITMAGIAFHLIGLSRQDNWALIGLVLPVVLVVLFVATRRSEARSSAFG